MVCLHLGGLIKCLGLVGGFQTEVALPASCSDLLVLFFISISEGCELFSGMLSSCMFVLISQDSLDELEMNDYWKEVENIASSERGAGRGDGEGDGEAHEEEHQKIPEGRICIVHG